LAALDDFDRWLRKNSLIAFSSPELKALRYAAATRPAGVSGIFATTAVSVVEDDATAPLVGPRFTLKPAPFSPGLKVRLVDSPDLGSKLTNSVADRGKNCVPWAGKKGAFE